MKNVIAVCIALTLILLLCLYLPAPKHQKDMGGSEDLTIQSTYTVREYEGQIAIFSPDSNMPVKVFDTSVSSLPKADREKLRNGITVSTPEELQRIIEDFTG